MSDPDLKPDLPTVGRFAGKAHVLPVRVYYEDTDFTGVVYHAGYLRFMERGRSEMLRSMGPPPGAPDKDPGVFAVIRIEIDFRAPARIHDALIVRTAFQGLDGARLVFRQTILRDDATLVEALVSAVALGSDGRVRRPTVAERTHWNGFGMGAAGT